MTVLPMAAFLSHSTPAILLNELNQIPKFHGLL